MENKMNFNDFLTCLTRLSENFDYEKLKKSDQGQRFLSIMENIETNKNLLPFDDFLEILNKKVKCDYCSSSNKEVFLKCGHGMCQTCLDSYLQENSLDCPICQSYLMSAGPVKSFTHCISCDLYLPDEMFYPEVLCHPHCKLCIEISFFKNKPNCSYCSKKLALNLETDYKCQECGKSLNIITCNYLCRTHQFCSDCFRIGINEQHCLKCNKDIDQNILIYSKVLLNPRCFFCKQNKEIQLFMQKTCCIKKICVACQLSFDTSKCKGCQIRFPHSFGSS